MMSNEEYEYLMNNYFLSYLRGLIPESPELYEAFKKYIYILETEELENKRRIENYNMKQILIQVLQNLGLKEEFSKNEILLQFIANNIDLGYIFHIGEISQITEDHLLNEFEEIIFNYQERLKKYITVDSTGVAASFVWRQNSNNVQKVKIFYNLKDNTTEQVRTIHQNKNIFFSSSSSISLDYKEENLGQIVSSSKIKYDTNNKMIFSEWREYFYLGDSVKQRYWIVKSELSNGKSIFLSGKGNDLFETKEIMTNYTEKIFDFVSYMNEMNDELDDNIYPYPTEEVLELFQRKGVNLKKYFVSPKDNKFYSIIYDYSEEMLSELLFSSDFSRVKRIKGR